MRLIHLYLSVATVGAFLGCAERAGLPTETDAPLLDEVATQAVTSLVVAEIIDLGALEGDNSAAYDINDRGVIVGTASLVGTAYSQVVRWLPDGTIEDLGNLGGGIGVAYGVNNAGAIVGYSNTKNYGTRAFIWTEADGMVGFVGPGAPHDYPVFRQARAINDRGQIVGEGFDAEGNYYPCIWENGQLTFIPGTGIWPSTAWDVNNRGEVVGGMVGPSSGEGHSFLWSESGEYVVLPSLDGTHSYPNYAKGVSESGYVIGISHNEIGAYHAFRWSEREGIHDLGSFTDPIRGWSSAFDVNDRGAVVGHSSLGPPSFLQHGFIWTESGGMVDLGSLCDECNSVAWGMNDVGEIVGYGQTETGKMHAILWRVRGG